MLGMEFFTIKPVMNLEIFGVSATKTNYGQSYDIIDWTIRRLISTLFCPSLFFKQKRIYVIQ